MICDSLQARSKCKVVAVIQQEHIYTRQGGLYDILEKYLSLSFGTYEA